MDNAERFWAKVDKSGECWEWTASLSTDRYGQLAINGRMFSAHRLSYMMNHPLTIDLLEGCREIFVCHRCDNPKCVNPAHLFLGSGADNAKDREAKGRGNQQKGEKHGNSKLTETQVREIRIKYATGGINQRQLALEYGISRQNIGDIINRKNWKHI